MPAGRAPLPEEDYFAKFVLPIRLRSPSSSSSLYLCRCCVFVFRESSYPICILLGDFADLTDQGSQLHQAVDRVPLQRLALYDGEDDV